MNSWSMANLLSKTLPKSFPGKWKVVYYPKDFTFVCPTEIVGFDKTDQGILTIHDAVLMGGSTDNEIQQARLAS